MYSLTYSISSCIQFPQVSHKFISNFYFMYHKTELNSCSFLNRISQNSLKCTNLLGELPEQWVSGVSCLGSTKFHLENVSDSQSGGESRTFFSYQQKTCYQSLSNFSLLGIDFSWNFPPTAVGPMKTRCFITSCFCSSPSWFRSNRLKTSSVLRESIGWFDSSCPWLGAGVWLSIRPLSWASCTTTRHSSSDRNPGISDRTRKKTTKTTIWKKDTFISHTHPNHLMHKICFFPLQIIWSLWFE